MPTYDYECRKCSKRFEAVHTITAHGKMVVKCPKCGSRRVGRRIDAFFAKTAKKS